MFFQEMKLLKATASFPTLMHSVPLFRCRRRKNKPAACYPSDPGSEIEKQAMKQIVNRTSEIKYRDCNKRKELDGYRVSVGSM